MSVPAPTIKHMIESLAPVTSDTVASQAATTADVPLERLEAQICELAGHLAAATCRFLLLVADFDARQGWASWDLPSCSAWLAWKCQMAPGTAREHVRVARALRELPVIRGEFTAGRMSYAKVRALTRIATEETDAHLAELAGPMTAGQLDRFVAAHRRVSSVDDKQSVDGRKLTWRVEEDGSLSMSVRLPPSDGAVLLRALRAACGDLEHPHRHADATVPVDVSGASPSLADALVDVASAFLVEKVAGAANPDIYHVIVHVGPEALTSGPDTEDTAASRPVGHPADPRRCHLEDGPAISPATAQRLACNAAVSWMLHDHRGNVLDVGRRHRRPSPALRRAVRERDRYRCQFPGCNSRRTDIHHIRHWAKGGKTRLRNLILVCEAHHVIVHAHGYVIATDGTGGFTFTRPDGAILPKSPQLEVGTADLTVCHDADITSATIVPVGLGDRLNLDLAIWACFANARIARERDVAAVA